VGEERWAPTLGRPNHASSTEAVRKKMGEVGDDPDVWAPHVSGRRVG
jgi:hypothetical protein